MSDMIPKSRPQMTQLQAAQILSKMGATGEVRLLAMRGYYKDTMGKPGVNDRKIYDDAIFLVGPEIFISFNANVDPGAFREGIANLVAGKVYKYKIGIHGWSKLPIFRYKALVQAAKVWVLRDGSKIPVLGWFAINIHKGLWNKVSSLGCQTLVPDQWPQFIALVEQHMKKHGQETIDYCLVEA